MFSILFYFFWLVFILGLFIGRWIYYAVLIFEGRKRIFPYRCLSCQKGVSLFPWPIRAKVCSVCSRRVDIRCTLLEYVTAICLSLLVLVLYPGWFLLEAGLFCIMALIACTVDIRRTILPDTLTIGGIGIALLGAWLNPERDFSSALTGLIVGGGSLALFAVFYYLLRKREGIGWGDIKMIGWIGALMGIQDLFYILSMACLLGIVYWLISVFKAQRSLTLGQQELAFGPYLAFSTYIFIVVSEQNLLF